MQTKDICRDTTDTDNKNDIFHKEFDTTNKNQETFLNWLNHPKQNIRNSEPTSLLIDTSPEYKGIQGLQEFWKNKITLSDKSTSSAALNGSYKKYATLESNLPLSKSISCLHNRNSLNLIDTAQFVNREHKYDDFYKHKNSSMKRISLDNSEIQQTGTKIPSSELTEKENQKIFEFGPYFPLVAATPTGEKIHWAKREHIFVGRKFEKVIKNYSTKTTNVANLPSSKSNILILNDEKIKHIKQKTTDDDINNSSIKLNTKEMIKVTSESSSKMAENTIETFDKTDIAKSHDGSTSSLNSNTQHRKRNPTNRKYSFKTHAKIYYNGPTRKMVNHHHNHSSGCSRVAALTYQFNQLVRKDAGILEEMKKKNGILLTRGAHVYKVKEEFDETKKKSFKKDCRSDDVPLVDRRKKSSLMKTNNSAIIRGNNKIVREVVQKFENLDECTETMTINTIKSDKIHLQKPIVPAKSDELLQRSKDITRKAKVKYSLINVKTKVKQNLDDHLEIVQTPNNEETDKEKLSTKINQTDLIEHDNGENESQPNFQEEEKNGDSYDKLYEKLKFSTPITEKRKIHLQTDECLELVNVCPTTTEDQCDQKIIKDIEYVDQKLENLNKSVELQSIENELSESNLTYEELKIKMKPNDSFLFRENSKHIPSQDEDNISFEKTINSTNSELHMKEESMNELNLLPDSIENYDSPNTIQRTDEMLSKLNESEYDPSKQDYYEPIGPQNTNTYETTKVSFLYKNKVEENIYATVNEKLPLDDNKNNVYQTFEEVKDDLLVEKPNSSENYESIEDCVSTLNDPTPIKKSEENVRNTFDELPPLPEVITNEFEEKHYSTLLPNVFPLELEQNTSNNKNHSNEHCFDDENIYDTIKGSETLSHCYEPINDKHILSNLDNASVLNCYESIDSLGSNTILLHSDSLSTLSSDLKTNSLYGITLQQQHMSLSMKGSSYDDNSDEWVDISEDDAENSEYKQQFIVVRERTKRHRSANWSKRVREQRSQKQMIFNSINDDSDHYYECLYARGDSKESANTTAATSLKTDDEVILMQQNNNQSHLNQQPKSMAENSFSDDYDSFDTDDEYDEKSKQNDSRDNINNVKLPDLPAPTNQVYAFVKKMKNLISNKKSSTSLSKTNNDNLLSKPDENTQFYVSVTPEYQNTMYSQDIKTKSCRFDKLKSSSLKKSYLKKHHNETMKLSPTNDDYENTEFHTLPQIPTTKNLPLLPENIPQTTSIDKNSSPHTVSAIPSKIDHSTIDDGISNSKVEVVHRKKSKTNKSFKSKLRKSLGNATDFNIGGALNNTNGARSTFYVSNLVDIDSGISEKNSLSDTNLSPASSSKQCDKQDASVSAITRQAKRSIESNRPKTTIGMRPNNPPPPPPIDKNGNQNKRTPTTSWYAECGVFKVNPQNNEMHIKDERGEQSNTSWYAEAGLYHTSGASVISSSGSSGVSTAEEGGLSENNSHSLFSNEPLYQIYSAEKLESISRDMEEQDLADGYEEIGNAIKNKSSDIGTKPSRPTALQLVGPKQGPARTLWSEIPEVINSEILSTLTPSEKRLQEAKFEILTSEASYLKSLNLLRSHFMNHPAFRDSTILSSSDHKSLFSYIVPVHECSDRLLSDLETCWQENIMLLGLSKNIYKHAEKYFHVYVSFCENQSKMDRTLRRLKSNKSGLFNQTLDALEADPVCCGLNLHSFLMLPMQRITRLPLLIDAVFSKIKSDDDEYEDWKITLAIVNKIVMQCNDAANRCEQIYEIEKISRQMEFPLGIRALAIAPVGVTAPGKKARFLVKKGELTHLIWRGDEAKLTFGRKITKCNIFLFLFTDLLVLTKKKNEEQYTVFDYCPRSMITVSSGDLISQLPIKELSHTGKNLFLLTLLENHEGKTVEMILSSPSISEQQRWLQAFSPPESENPDEKLYEQWDCPQVIAKHSFLATEPDLLSLEPGDVINVTKKMADGWYQGERIRDGITGWFPGSYTEEVNSSHIRARNLKQRYRLLTFTASYLETIKKNK